MAKDFKKYLVMKPEVTRIFDELDRYRQFQKRVAGKEPKNNGDDLVKEVY